MRPLLPVISVSVSVALNNLKFETTNAFHAAAAPHSDRCQSTIANPFNNHHHHHQLQQQHRVRKNPIVLCATRGAPDGGEEAQQQQPDADDNNEASVGFTALPPIGASSFRDYTRPGGENNTDDQPSKLESNNNNNKNIIVSEHTNLVSSKFQIQYTCKVCSTRNSHSVSRLAYRKGVVIAMCKGCLCRHLLADNLGWSNYAGGFNFDDGETNIEMYMENKARENGNDDEKKENDLVMRVNREVFDLEHVLYKGQGKDMTSAIGAMEGGDQQGDDENEIRWG